jgi:hypothetical protein
MPHHDPTEFPETDPYRGEADHNGDKPEYPDWYNAEPTTLVSPAEIERRRRANSTAIEGPTTPKPEPHVHQFGPAKLSADGAGGSFRQCECGYWTSVAEANGYEKGVADAQRHG